MGSKIAITGIGIITAIGNNAEGNLASLLREKHGISHLDHLQSGLAGKLPCGEIKLDNSELNAMAAPEKKAPGSRTALLAMIACKQAIQNAGLKANQLKEAALISSTSVGGIEISENAYDGVLHNNINDPVRNFAEHDCGSSTQYLANETGINGYITTISTACSSSANAIMLGARMIKSGMVERAIVGGADALSRFTLNGFNSLMILDQNHCSPFDRDRMGLNLGEGSAFLVLEAEHLARDKNVHAWVSGYGNTNDAHHQTASSDTGEGALLAIQHAMKTAGLGAGDIGYVNAHGTGTVNNDASEGNALKRYFGNEVPPFSSTKVYTGHTLAAAGAIEAVYVVFSLQNGLLYNNLNFKNAPEETLLSPVTATAKGQDIDHILSNSFGFGGNCTSLVFSKN